MTPEEFLQKAKERNPYFEQLEYLYIPNPVNYRKSYIEYRCKKHGVVCRQRVVEHLQGRIACRQCINERIGTKNRSNQKVIDGLRKTHSRYAIQVNKLPEIVANLLKEQIAKDGYYRYLVCVPKTQDGNIYRKTQITVKCLKHNKVFETTIERFFGRRQISCMQCVEEKRQGKLWLPESSVLPGTPNTCKVSHNIAELLKTIVQQKGFEAIVYCFDKEAYSVNDDITYKCLKHNVVGKQRVQLLLQGRVPCRKCVNERLYQRGVIKKAQENAKRTFLLRYGVEHPFSVPEIRYRAFANRKSKLMQSVLARLKQQVPQIEPLFGNNTYNGVKDQIYKFRCKQCNTIFEAKISDGKIPLCPVCYGGQSEFESQLLKFLDDLKPYLSTPATVITNRRLLDGLEIDVYLPGYKVGIEIHGLYYHTEQAIEQTRHTILRRYGISARYYHALKQDIAEHKGIRLLQIFSDEWIYQNNLVKSIIAHALGVRDYFDSVLSARDCIVVPISEKEANEFYVQHHIQGPIYGCRYHFGLVHKKTDELVACLSIGKHRFSKGQKGQQLWELYRFCTDHKSIVRGALSKLLTHALRTIATAEDQPIRLISYVDRRLFSATGYKALQQTSIKVQYLGKTEPGFWLVDGHRRLNRMHFQKHKLLKKQFEQKPFSVEQLTERQLQQLLGLERIWDAGHYQFSLELA